MAPLTFSYRYEWRGETPDYLVFRKRPIVGADLFANELMDPVKGHIYDLDRDQCLIHTNCDCRVYVICFAKFNRHRIASTAGWVPQVRKAVRFLQQQFQRIEDTAKNGDFSWFLMEG